MLTRRIAVVVAAELDTEKLDEDAAGAIHVPGADPLGLELRD